MESGIVTQMLRKPGPGGASVEAGGVDRVRPMTEPDLARVLELYRRVFPGRDAGGLRPVEKHLRDVLSGNPWRNETLPSLVYEDGAGRIAGCLGVMPRPMSFGGRPIQAAISHTFMVEPGSRSSLAALALARAFLSGGQDLSIAEGGGPSRRILERFGGSTSLLLSLRWTRPLRPGRYLLSLLKRRGLAAPLRWALAPLGAAADALAPAFLGRTARLAPPREAGEELTTGDLLECMSRVCADRSLCPTYDSNALDWLLNLLAKGQGRYQRGRAGRGGEDVRGGGPRPPVPSRLAGRSAGGLGTAGSGDFPGARSEGIGLSPRRRLVVPRPLQGPRGARGDSSSRRLPDEAGR